MLIGKFHSLIFSLHAIDEEKAVTCQCYMQGWMDVTFFRLATVSNRTLWVIDLESSYLLAKIGKKNAPKGTTF